MVFGESLKKMTVSVYSCIVQFINISAIQRVNNALKSTALSQAAKVCTNAGLMYF